MRPLYQGFTVEVVNLEQTIANLGEIDAGMAKEMKRAIRELAKPTLDKARGYANGLGSHPTGAYAHSLSLKTRKNGVQFVSTDPGGGVIEFANIGAIILTGKRKGRRAPVPHTGTPPRALLRAILEDTETLVEGLNDALYEYAAGVISFG